MKGTDGISPHDQLRCRNRLSLYGICGLLSWNPQILYGGYPICAAVRSGGVEAIRFYEEAGYSRVVFCCSRVGG
ncbi:MAG TPA: hypothetical protein VKZ57_10250 [Sphingobacterium sp.]|nr:hypothetical protein [Sphingobacterium sp.]